MKALADTILAIFVGGILLLFLGSSIRPLQATSSNASPDDSPAPHQLKAEPYHCDKLYDDIRCEGRVTNISGQPLRRVLAVAECFTKGGGFVTSDWSGIEYDPILDGQTSPYRVIVRYNPAIAGCKTSFKYLSGASIPTDEPAPPAAKAASSTRRK